MVRARRTTALFFVALVFLGGVPALGSPKTAAASPLCVDAQSSAILQDSGWHNFSSSFSDYSRKYDESAVSKQGSNYVMYVREENYSTSGIYRGVSPDGIHWNIAPTPVLTTGPKGAWDEGYVLSPDVVWNGTGYMMYYVGDGFTSQNTFPANFRQIGVAFSADGTHWSKYGNNPVITHGPSWYDHQFTRGPSVLFDGGTYKMWYFGDVTGNSTTPQLSTIEYATSADGVHWNKYSGNPVFRGFVQTGGSTVARWPSVVKVNGTYLMAFSSNFADLGFATSANGINWSFNNSTNVLMTLSGWHSGSVTNPSIVLDQSRLLLWYSGYDNSNLSTKGYVAGIGFAVCGLFLAPSPVTTTISATSVFVFTKSVVSTSISTSIIPITLASTVTVGNQNAITVQVATAGVVGFAAAIAIAVSLIALRIRSRRVP